MNHRETEAYYASNRHYKPRQLFSFGNNYFLYNCWDSVYAEIAKDCHDEFCSQGDELGEGIVGDAMGQALAKTFMKWPCDEQGRVIRADDPGHVQQALDKTPRDVFTLMLHVARACNMRCRYCYGHGGTFGGSAGLMSEETAFAVIDWYTGTATAQEKKQIDISFMGGEPLMNFALIKIMILYLAEHFSDWKKKYSMTTNGYFLTDEVIAFLIEHEVNILISFDGPPDIQNFNRPLVSGEDSYAAIVPKLKKLLALRPETCARATLYNNVNSGLVEAGLREIGFRKTFLLPAMESILTDDYCAEPTLANDVANVTRDFGHRADRFLQATQNKEAAAVREALSDKKFFEEIAFLADNENLLAVFGRRRKFYYCGVGVTLLVVDADGTLYPCPSLVGTEKFRLGQIGTAWDNSFWHRSMLLESKECAECFCKYSCGGGCRFDNLSVTGELFAPNTDYCRNKRETLKYAIYTMSQLTEADLDWLRQENILSAATPNFDF